MKPTGIYRALLLSAALTAASAPSLAQVNVIVTFGPPVAPVEVVPVVAPGYVWAPGYYAWNGERYIWVRGRPILQRVGYAWVPDRWVERKGHFSREHGHWARGRDFRPVHVQTARHEGHDQGNHNGHFKDKDHDRGNHHGGKHRGKHGD